jgi:hypothetical protein
MRLLLTLILGCAAVTLVPAWAQVPSIVIDPARNISADDLKEYCIFNDRLYSIGAFICAARRRSLQCERPDKGGRASWKFVTSEECEPNPSLTPQ